MINSRTGREAPRWRVLTVIGSAAMAVVIGSGGQPAEAANPAPDQVGCGSVVTGKVRLTRDLLGCTGNGLVIGADGTDLDLNGHTITGAGVFASLSGVDIDGYAGVRVHGGQIADFGRGVLGYRADRIRIERVEVTGTLEAVNLQESSGVRVTVNRLSGNREGLTVRGLSHAVVADNRVIDNDTSGISDIGSRSTVYRANRVERNTFDGFSLEGAVTTVLVDNLVRENGLDGINAVTGSDVRYVGNRIVRNDEHGINDSGDRTLWRRNVAIGNGRVGLLADGVDAVDAGGNQARRNGERDCAGVACS